MGLEWVSSLSGFQAERGQGKRGQQPHDRTLVMPGVAESGYLGCLGSMEHMPHTVMPLYRTLDLSLGPSIRASIYPRAILPSNLPSTHAPYAHMPTRASILPSIRPSIRPTIVPSTYPPIHPFIHLSVDPVLHTCSNPSTTPSNVSPIRSSFTPPSGSPTPISSVVPTHVAIRRCVCSSAHRTIDPRIHQPTTDIAIRGTSLS